MKFSVWISLNALREELQTLDCLRKLNKKIGWCVAGAIFTQDQKDSSSELAFKYAVYKINKDKNLLPDTTLVYDVQHVPRDDSFHASKKGNFTLIFILFT